MDLIYKRANTMYLKLLTCKSQEFQVTNTFCACFHQMISFKFAPVRFLGLFYHPHHFWLNNCCWLDISQNFCTKWNLWYFWFKRVWLKTKYFEDSHSFDFWFNARQRHRFDGGHFTKYDDQINESDFIVYSTVIKFIPAWRHEIS